VVAVAAVVEERKTNQPDLGLVPGLGRIALALEKLSWRHQQKMAETKTRQEIETHWQQEELGLWSLVAAEVAVLLVLPWLT
jgi:hypothetical protein